MNKRLEQLSEERISRIVQKSRLNFAEKPPESLVNAVSECAKTWNRDRAARHRPDGLIYHYCDATALLNILKYRKVWATSTKYLNDSSELLSFTAGMSLMTYTSTLGYGIGMEFRKSMAPYR